MRFSWALGAVVTTALTVTTLAACASTTASPASQAAATAKTSASPAHCATAYHQPADWDTKQVVSKTPGIANYIEPLNVVLSACSTVSLSALQAALETWNSVSTTSSTVDGLKIACISTEQADVTGKGYVNEQESWRYHGCVGGNILSLIGKEAHVRLWNQPVSGTRDGAWFVTASYETACVSVGGKLYKLAAKHPAKGASTFHCIDGGPGSYDADGYDRGAKDFAGDIVAAANAKGWGVTEKTVTRPVTGGKDAGEDGVKFTGTVYVLTVTS